MRFLAVALVAMLMVAGASANAEMPLPRDQSFNIVHDGKKIGTMTMRFRRDDGYLVAEVNSDIKVKLALITAYKRKESMREVWRNGELIKFTSEVDDNGDKYRVKAKRGEKGLKIVGKNHKYVAPDGILPATYWNPATVDATSLIDIKRGQVLNVDTERVGEETVDVNGQSVTTTRYSMDGDRRVDLWYDADGGLIQMKAGARDGRIVDFVPN